MNMFYCSCYVCSLIFVGLDILYKISFAKKLFLFLLFFNNLAIPAADAYHHADIGDVLDEKVLIVDSM